MEALLAAARNGINPRGATLFCTTFPCHNCAKHIVAAGVCRVIYVEPYPKSQAIQLHDDSIGVISPCAELSNKVRFEPFVGVGPRRYLDLFSLTLSTGRVVKRNERGRTVPFDRCKATLRIPMLPVAYLQREKIAVDVLEKCEQS
jgi:deoxycytidylate deaminase